MGQYYVDDNRLDSVYVCFRSESTCKRFYHFNAGFISGNKKKEKKKKENKFAFSTVSLPWEGLVKVKDILILHD